MTTNSNIIQLNMPSTTEVCLSVAMRVKQRRLELNLTQQGLAMRADVNIETYRRFERTGEIAFLNLAKIAFALDALNDFDLLFSQKKYERIEDIILSQTIKRKRGKRI
jgi:transcriptional regulator with XRE-family HTH domain